MLRVWSLAWALVAQMRSRTTSLPWLRLMLALKLENTTGNALLMPTFGSSATHRISLGRDLT